MTPMRTGNGQPVRLSRDEGIVQISQNIVDRLIQLGLPETQALTAREAVAARLENFSDRLMAGEWEPR